MNKLFAIPAAAALLIILAGCGGTEIYDPTSTHTDIRQESSISAEEMRIVAQHVAHRAMTHPKFLNFLKAYQKKHNALPILKLEPVYNATDDPDLNCDQLTELLNEFLLDTGKVDITLAEGRAASNRSSAIRGSRKLEDDDLFDQSTVAKYGTVKAASLILRPKIISNTVRDGRRKAIVRTFVLDMINVEAGLAMFKITKQLGFTKTRGVAGW